MEMDDEMKKMVEVLCSVKLQLTELNTAQWILILDDLALNGQFTLVTKLLKGVPKTLMNEIVSKCMNSFACHLSISPEFSIFA